MEGIASPTSLTQGASPPAQQTRPAAAEQAQQAAQIEAAQRAEELAARQSEPPAPVVNELGQTTGTIINETA